MCFKCRVGVGALGILLNMKWFLYKQLKVVNLHQELWGQSRRNLQNMLNGALAIAVENEELLYITTFLGDRLCMRYQEEANILLQKFCKTV